MKNGTTIPIGEYMENIRKEKGLSEDVISAEIGISKSTYRHVKNGRKDNITVDTLTKITKYFGCSADFVLGTIKRPTHRLTNINAATGLTDTAILNLKEIHSAADDPDTVSGFLILAAQYGLFKDLESYSQAIAGEVDRKWIRQYDRLSRVNLAPNERIESDDQTEIELVKNICVLRLQKKIERILDLMVNKKTGQGSK